MLNKITSNVIPVNNYTGTSVGMQNVFSFSLNLIFVFLFQKIQLLTQQTNRNPRPIRG